MGHRHERCEKMQAESIMKAIKEAGLQQLDYVVVSHYSTLMEQRPAVESIGDASKYSAPAPAVAFAWSGAVLFVASLTFFLYAYLVRFAAAAPPGSWFPPAAVDVALFSAFALHHSLLARTPLRLRSGASSGRPSNDR